MASNGRNAENSTNLLTELAEKSTHGIGELGKTQIAAVERLQQLTHHWLNRWQSETELLTDFSVKLATARSIPEITKVCQDLADRQWKMATEDAKRIVDGGQALVFAGAQLFTNGSSRLQSLSS